MKNLTVSIDDKTYTHARVVAAKRGISVSRLVRDYLNRIDEAGDQAPTKPSFHVFQVENFNLLDRDERHWRRG